MRRLDCDCDCYFDCNCDCDWEFLLGIWAIKHAKSWASKEDLINLNLRQYHAQELRKRIMVIKSNNVVNFTLTKT